MLRKGHLLSVWVVLALVCFVPQFPGQSSSQFYAVYDWITDADQLGYGLHVSELTPDGNKIFFVNYAGNTGRKGRLHRIRICLGWKLLMAHPALNHAGQRL